MIRQKIKRYFLLKYQAGILVLLVIMKKLDSWAHTNEKEYNPEYLFSEDVVKSIIKEGKDLFGRNYKYKIVPLSESFPRYLINNKDKYDEIIG